jgi:copper chaperone CopZ
MTKKTLTFEIEGMSCNGCARAISNALNNLNGIDKITAAYPEGIARVTFEKDLISKKKIIETIEELGYHVKGEK